MRALDLDKFRGARLVRQPFPYIIVPGFVRVEAGDAIHADYPVVEHAGSFPVESVTYGPAFQNLLSELQGDEMRAAFETKFGMDLTDRPTMVTVRGRCDPRDGRIHTDALTKLITVLIYMNPKWESPGGCLRLLHSSDNLDDAIIEVPPLEGTLLAFKRTDNSWHGHKPFEGPRRVIQLNWVTSAAVRRRELFRHRLSAWSKRFAAMFRPWRRAA
jgi:hypothetical protein